jgi:hypothetical protein
VEENERKGFKQKEECSDNTDTTPRSPNLLDLKERKIKDKMMNRNFSIRSP